MNDRLSELRRGANANAGHVALEISDSSNPLNGYNMCYDYDIFI
jgi:hypothetical protein